MTESITRETPRHVVAVVGAATAGAEIAHILAKRGALVVVIEQNPRPYGKIEDGLPRWHVKQRRDEYEEINRRLDHPNIEFVPLTRMGADVTYDDLRQRWGLSAVVLAHGAWRDRPLAVEGADQYIDRGLVYQNRLIYWFNHYPEKAYDGPRFDLAPGAMVIGGGLASIDVVKVLQIETALKALRARGIEEDMLRLEREGLEPVLAARGLKYADLGVTPCKLYYRRRVLDMPLSDIAPDAPPKRAEAMRAARAKILEKAQRKYLFEFEPLRVPTGLIVEDGQMVGLQMSRTEVADGQVRTIPDSASSPCARRSPSVPSAVSPSKYPASRPRARYTPTSTRTSVCSTTARRRYIAAGNVLTGKGNIKDSLESGTFVGIHVAESYLGLNGDDVPLAEGARKEAEHQGERIAEAMKSRPGLGPQQVDEVIRRVRERQRAIGYEGNYRAWIKRMTPVDLH